MNVAPAEAPDLLTVIEALVAADAGPPGFVGRLAIGLCTAEDLRWLLLEIDQGKVRCSRTEDSTALADFDCIWLLPHQPGLFPDAQTRSIVDGDRTLLTRFDARYLQTRSHLGFQMQRITSARASTRKRTRASR